MTNTVFRLSLLLCLAGLSLLFHPNTVQAQPGAALNARQLADLDKFMAPYRKKVTDVLDADKTGQYKKYLSDLKALSQTRDAAAFKRLEEKLKKDHYAFIQKHYKKAVINHEEMKAGIAKILGHRQFTLDEFGGIKLEIVLPPIKIAPKTDITLTAPYESSQHEANITAIGEDCSATVTTSTVQTRSGALFDGGCRSKGSLGDKFDIPAGTFSKITVNAQYDFDYRGYAYAGIAYSQVNAKVGLRLQGPGVDKVVILKENSCVAPLIWFSSFDDGVNNFQANHVFTGNFAGGTTYTAQVYNETFAIALSPLLGASSESKSNTKNIDFIKVKIGN